MATLVPGPLAPNADKLSKVTYVSVLTQVWTVHYTQATKDDFFLFYV